MNYLVRTLKRLVVLALSCFVLVQLASRVAAFVHLFGNHAGLVLTQAEAAQAYSAQTAGLHRGVVPRIIHQIYHNWSDASNETIPSDWAEARQTCIDVNQGWDIRLWTAQTSRDFIRREYPWFLRTYDNFKFPVQRIDTLKYFLLRHYGGIYMDLDNGCMTGLEPLRFYPAWVVDGARGALSNNILGGEPNHPYWVLMTDSIIPYAWNYPLPYITISYATGQWFETEIWEKYHRQKSNDAPHLTRIITDCRPEAAPPVFFTQTRGETWHNWDNRLFEWIGENLITVAFIAVGAVLLISALALVACRRTRGVVEKWRKWSQLRSRRLLSREILSEPVIRSSGQMKLGRGSYS